MYPSDPYDEQVEVFLEGMRGLERGINEVQIRLCMVAAALFWKGSKGFRRKDNTVNWDNPDDKNTAIPPPLGVLYLAIGLAILIFAVIIIPLLMPDLSFLDTANR